MSYTSTKNWLILLVFLGAFLGLGHAQQKIDPTTQIAWPKITGNGAPATTCSAVNSGQPYEDVAGNVSYFCNGTTSTWVQSSGGGGGSCPLGTCVQNNSPGSDQTVVQGPGYNLEVNNLSGEVWADQYGSGNNGIETAYAQCLAQNGLGYSGCQIKVSQNYGNADVPAGWQSNASAFSNPPMQLPSGGAVDDERNGTHYKLFHNPLNPVTGQGSGDVTVTQYDATVAQSNAVVSGPNLTGRYNLVNILNGGSEWYFALGGMPVYLTETYTYGTEDTLNNYVGGINFLHYDQINKRSNGDTYRVWSQVTCDAGIFSANSEGCADADRNVREDPVVFTGTISGAPATGATQVQVNATIGANTQGAMYRWLVNQSSPLYTGTQLTGFVTPLTTGSAGNSAIMPPAIIDSTKTFSQSTIVQLCYAGSDNGAGGAAGCTSGSQPVGYVPSQNYKFTITGGSVSGGLGTFSVSPTSPQTTPITLVVGQPTTIYGFSLTGPAKLLNGQTVTVISFTGGNQFTANVTGYSALGSTGTGFGTYSPTGYSPAAAITMGIVPTYSTSGGTGGLPTGFCTPSNTQSGNPAGSCYMPASGVGCLTDQGEVEPVSYSYNSGTQQVTINNMQFPHLNGAMFAVGGLACKSIEDLSTVYSGGGTSGTIDEVYPAAGSLDSHTVYYVPQRTNLGYASPPMGGSTDGSSANGGVNAAQKSTLCFSTTMSNISLTSGVVSFNMGQVPGTNGGQYGEYDGLTVTLAVTGNSSFSGSYQISNSNLGSGFSYTPTSPSGSATTGTVSFCNAGYKILDSARILSVQATSNGAINNSLGLFPNNASFNGATVRSPHYQQIRIAGNHLTETQFQESTYLGTNSDTLTYQGNISGPGWGLIINNNGTNNYLGGGGTMQPPTQALALFGTWLDSIQVTAPQSTVLDITGWNLHGPSSALSTFGIVKLPALPSAFSGYSIDSFCYNPAYNLANRGNAASTGEWIFGNATGINCGAGPSNGHLVSTVRMGNLLSDFGVISPEVTANDVSIVPLSGSLGNAPQVVGDQTGTTVYNYELVARDKNNQPTLAVHFGPTNSISNGQATLNGTNFNRLCAFSNPGVFSYDFLKQVSGVYQSMALNVAVGNGAAHGSVPNYTCWDDQGGGTSAYTMPTANTTGSLFANSIVSTYITANTWLTVSGTLYMPGLTVGDCLQVGSSFNIVGVTGGCTGGGGGGMVYPGAGVASSSGSGWNTSYTVGAAANNLVQLDGSARLPAVDASLLTNYQYANLAGTVPIWNQSTNGNAAGLSTILVPTWGGTGLDSHTSTGVAQVSSGTWTIGLTLPSGLTIPSATLTAPILGTPAGGNAANITNLQMANASGTLAYSHLPALSANQLLGALTGTTPSGISMPSCFGTGQALTWTPGTGPGCTTVSGSITGGLANVVPLYSGTNSIGAQSHLDDGATLAGYMTFTEPVNFATSGNGFAFTEGTAPSGVSGQDLLAPVTSSHGWQFNNNNGGWQNLIGSFGGVFTGSITAPSMIFPGSSSGQVTIQAQTAAGTPTLTLPSVSGQITTTTANVYTLSGSGSISPNDTLSVITLTASSSFTMSSAASGTNHTLCFIQGSGSYTVTPPANVHGYQAIGNTNGDWNCQIFIYSAGSSRWVSNGPMQQNIP